MPSIICRVCDSTDLQLAIDLGNQPWGNDFLTAEQVGKEPFYPLRVFFCSACSTAQLDYTVRKEVMFADHSYLSGVTRTLSDHFKGVAQEVDQRFFKDTPGKAVLDIGSNDGTQLKHFQDLGWEALGVEPSRTIAKMANESGVPTLNEFFSEQCARQIDRRFNVINAAGVFFHLEELHSVAEGIRAALLDDGVFVVQFLYMKRIIENTAFDQIYHEHLLYYNLKTLETLLNRHGLALFDAYLAPVHGGSVMGFATRQGKREPSERLQAMRRREDDDRANSLETYKAFALEIEESKSRNVEYMKKVRAAGKTVYGMGAPVKGNTLLNYYGFGPDDIEYLVEINEMRRGLYAPGSHIPIRIEDELTHEPDIYYVLAWNFKKEILVRYKDMIDRGVELYFPVDPREDL